MKTGYIYTLDIDEVIFYVGKTTLRLQDALARHMSDARKNSYGGNKEKIKFINNALESGKTINIQQVVECSVEDLSFEEEFYIKYFKFLNCSILNKKLIY
jgi:hypothetical protein